MRTVVLDACVLYPALLRDLLLSLGRGCPVELQFQGLGHDQVSWSRRPNSSIVGAGTRSGAPCAHRTLASKPLLPRRRIG